MTVLNITNWSELLTGSAVGITVVFIVLTVIVLFFLGLQRFMLNKSKKKMVKAGKSENEIVQIAANEVAAISMALHLLYSDEHDEESNIITIKRIQRRYSPWNSKIYGLNNNIQRR
jgi:Na+-transporting methylmalonyl-CoA/oxaloacetate decarboxylase gamma subunit